MTAATPKGRVEALQAFRMTDQCNRCHFWRPDPTSGSFDEEPVAFGRCRRYPPTLSDHMATYAIGTPSFGHHVDPEVLADTSSVYNACVLPATFCTDWCGEFIGAGPAAIPVRDSVKLAPNIEADWQIVREQYGRGTPDEEVLCAAEQRMLDAGVKTPRDATIMLMHAMLHHPGNRPDGIDLDRALISEDVAAITTPDIYRQFDWDAKFIIAALVGLHAAGAAA